MKFINLSLLFILLFSYCSCSQHKFANSKFKQTEQIDIFDSEKFKSYCKECAVDGSIAIYHVENKRWIVSDTIGIYLETLPASTFKIINLLIALETNTINSEQDIVKWVGKTDTLKYGYRPDIYHDMSVAEAFESSAGWVFVELAKKIGKAKYKQYLSKCHFGNNNLSQVDADFWNFGNFAISPQNQVEFLTALYEEKLPFSRRNMEIVKKVMLNEKTEDYSLFAKTGWTRDKNINTGWWTGYIETKKGTYIFATRLLQDRAYNRADFGNCRKLITKKVFSDLGIIN